MVPHKCQPSGNPDRGQRSALRKLGLYPHSPRCRRARISTRKSNTLLVGLVRDLRAVLESPFNQKRGENEAIFRAESRTSVQTDASRIERFSCHFERENGFEADQHDNCAPDTQSACLAMQFNLFAFESFCEPTFRVDPGSSPSEATCLSYT